MALVLTKFDLTITLSCTDDDGARVTRDKSFEIAINGADADAQRANAQAEAAAFVPAYAAVTGAQIIQYRLTEIFVENAIATPSDNLYKELVLTLDVVGKLNDATMFIPAPNGADILTADGKSADVGSTELLALLARFTGANLARISDGDTLTTANPIVRSRVRSVASGKTY